MLVEVRNLNSVLDRIELIENDTERIRQADIVRQRLIQDRDSALEYYNYMDKWAEYGIAGKPYPEVEIWFGLTTERCMSIIAGHEVRYPSWRTDLGLPEDFSMEDLETL